MAPFSEAQLGPPRKELEIRSSRRATCSGFRIRIHDHKFPCIFARVICVRAGRDLHDINKAYRCARSARRTQTMRKGDALLCSCCACVFVDIVGSMVLICSLFVVRRVFWKHYRSYGSCSLHSVIV